MRRPRTPERLERHATTPSPEPPNRPLVFALLAAAMMLAAIQLFVASVALPAIIDSLHPPLRWAGWLFSGFTVGLIVTLPLAGRLTARAGARQVFIAGLIGFAATSALCALAPNIWVLILARVAQGVASGLVQPAIYGIVSEHYPAQRARWIGLLASLIPVSAILGLNLGGVLGDYAGWRWAFGFSVPIVLVMIGGAYRVLPAGGTRLPDTRLNLPHVALLGAFALILVYGLTELGRSAADSQPVVIVAALSLAAALLVVLLLREARSADPLVDLDLLRRREFAFANGLAFFFGGAFTGVLSFIPLYIQTAYGLSATQAAVLLTPRAVATVTISTAAALILQRTGYRKPILLGLWTMAGTLVLLSRGWHDPVLMGLPLSTYAWLATLNALLGAGIGFCNPALQNVSLDLAPDRIPAVAGLRGMFNSLGGAASVPLITAVTARAGTLEHGLELAFLGLGAVFTLSALLAFGIPELRRPAAEVHGASASVLRPAARGKHD